MAAARHWCRSSRRSVKGSPARGFGCPAPWPSGLPDEQIAHASQLLRDLLRRLVCMAILAGACGRYDREAGHRRQLPTNRVGQAVGEIRITGVANVLEWENGDTHGARRRRHRAARSPSEEDADPEQKSQHEQRQPSRKPSMALAGAAAAPTGRRPAVFGAVVAPLVIPNGAQPRAPARIAWQSRTDPPAPSRALSGSRDRPLRVLRADRSGPTARRLKGISRALPAASDR